MENQFIDTHHHTDYSNYQPPAYVLSISIATTILQVGQLNYLQPEWDAGSPVL